MNRCNFNGRDGAVSGKGGEMGGRATWSPPAVDRKGRETPAADGCRIRRRTSDGRNAAIPRDSMAVESTNNRTSFVNDRQQQRSVIAQPWTAGLVDLQVAIKSSRNFFFLRLWVCPSLTSLEPAPAASPRPCRAL
jgi:hypothetical protein